LDAAMAADEGQGIVLNYNAPALFGQGDLDDYSGIPDAAIEYAALRLAKAICSKMGKMLSQDARGRLASAKDVALTITARPARAEYSYGTPRGAGNRAGFGWSPYLPWGRRPC
jgi:hypothetical protein